ncbi:MAG: Fic family protein [Verrucomicrobiales bacterium]
MEWNWQRPDWPEFSYHPEALAPLETTFLSESGKIAGAFAHLDDKDRDTLRIELLSDEALGTSRIEGEVLDRESVQFSLRADFGIPSDRQHPVGPKERGITELLVEAYRTFADPLTDQSLRLWHKKLMCGQLEDHSLGRYRTGNEPMQIVSGDPFDPEIHFEAPPSPTVAGEMKRYLDWFNTTVPTKSRIPLPSLARAAIAHLHFETIHPFSDGNGRIGRAIAEKALSQAMNRPLLLALSHTIEKDRKQYYQALASTRFTNDITAWVTWFGEAVIRSVEDSRGRVEFVIQKTQFFDRYRGSLNERQEKVLRRIFREGPRGFKGGLSAGKYERIAKTSPATARRDLGRLVTLGALTRTGKKKGTRYHVIL